MRPSQMEMLMLSMKICFTSSDLCDSDLNAELKQIGAVFIHGRDKDGCPLLVFKGRLHQKRKEWIQDQKNLFLYLCERLEK